MLKIYDNKSDVPEEEKEFFDKHYKKRSDGKYEPDIEGINSIGGVLSKNDELLEKVKEIPNLKSQLRELESKEILTDGKVAVDKTEYDSLKTENDSYKQLGDLNDIKPKVEGYDALKTQAEQDARKKLLTKAFEAAGIKNIDGAFDLKQSDALNIETETKDGKEVYYVVTEKDGKPVKTLLDNAYLKEADGFKNNWQSLTGTATPKGNTIDPPPVGASDDAAGSQQRRATESRLAQGYF